MEGLLIGVVIAIVSSVVLWLFLCIIYDEIRKHDNTNVERLQREADRIYAQIGARK